MHESYDRSFGYPSVLIGRKIVRLLFLNLRSFDITPEQWTILRLLGENEKVTQKELSEVSGKDQPTINRILHIMDRKGWITRLANKHDRRSFFICLTMTGRTLLKEVQPVVEETFETILHDIDEEQLEFFQQMLKKLDANLEHELSEQKVIY